MSRFRVQFSIEGRKSEARTVVTRQIGPPTDAKIRGEIAAILKTDYRCDLVDVELRRVSALDGDAEDWAGRDRPEPLDSRQAQTLTVDAVGKMRKSDLITAAAELGIDEDFSQVKAEDLRAKVLSVLAARGGGDDEE